MDRWGFFFGLVGIAALVLAIPMSILANIFTPKVRDWWATTSKVRALKRYIELGREVNRFKRGSEFNALARFCAGLLAVLIAGFVSTLSIAFFLGLNENYIATINGMKLDKPVPASEIHVVGLSSLYTSVLFYLLFCIAIAIALSRSRFISSSHRHRHLARLRLQRYRLKKKLGLCG